MDLKFKKLLSFLLSVLGATFPFLQIITLDAVLNNSAYLNLGTSQ